MRYQLPMGNLKPLTPLTVKYHHIITSYCTTLFFNVAHLFKIKKKKCL